jgi:hypothetical protein
VLVNASAPANTIVANFIVLSLRFMSGDKTRRRQMFPIVTEARTAEREEAQLACAIAT